MCEARGRFEMKGFRKQIANQQKQLRNDVFHVKTSQSAKNKLDTARTENWPKKRYTPFLHASLQLRARLFPELYSTRSKLL